VAIFKKWLLLSANDLFALWKR